MPMLMEMNSSKESLLILKVSKSADSKEKIGMKSKLPLKVRSHITLQL